MGLVALAQNRRQDIAANKSSNVGVRDIVAKHVSESAQGLIHKVLCGRGTKRKRGSCQGSREQQRDETRQRVRRDRKKQQRRTLRRDNVALGDRNRRAKTKHALPLGAGLIKGTFSPNFLSVAAQAMSQPSPEFVSTEFDIFATKPTQSSILGTAKTRYKPIAPVDQSDLEFVIPGVTNRT